MPSDVSMSQLSDMLFPSKSVPDSAPDSATSQILLLSISVHEQYRLPSAVSMLPGRSTTPPNAPVVGVYGT